MCVGTRARRVTPGIHSLQVDGFTDVASELAVRGSVLPGDHVIAVNGKVIEGLGQRHLRVPSVLLCRSRGNGQDT